MPLYEHVFMARQDVSTQQVEQLTDHFKGILDENGGKVSMVESWGLRSLAYKIKKNRKAHYVRLNIEAEPAAITEMERQMRIHEDILRFMTLRVEAHDTEPAKLLTAGRGGRDDRRGGGRGGFDRDRGPRRDDRGPRRDDRAPREDRAPAAEASAE